MSTTTSRSEVYGVRLSPEELTELRAKAKAADIELADAFRDGVKMYLSAEGAIQTSMSQLESAVAKAQKVLRSAREES